MFVPAPHPTDTVLSAIARRAAGETGRQIAQALDVPLDTVWGWLGGRLPREARIQLEPERWCSTCRGERHAYEDLPTKAYSYLLGMYLGDGNIGCHGGRSYSLRLSMDCGYGEIVAEAYDAIFAVRGRTPRYQPIYGERALLLVSYWASWPCLFPQHGPGRKHSRPIYLADWQREIVAADPRPFLRGLIHSDGWRGLNRVHVKGKDYAYPRYQFSNRSQDIKDLFCWACDLLGVEWRPWARHHISVARRDSVARLDEFIGPKR